MKKVYKSIFLSFIIFITSCFSVKALTISNWAEGSYESLKKEGIINEGFLKDQDYTKKITREDFTVLLIEYVLKSNDKIKLSNAKSPFKDTKNEYVVTANQHGIVSGIKKDTFLPNESIKREEACLMIYKAENIANKIAKSDTINYKDKYMISIWAMDAVTSLTNEKIISGMPDGNFYPKKAITIEESFSIINRLILKNKEDEKNTKTLKVEEDPINKTEYEFIFKNMPSNFLSQNTIEREVKETSYEKRKNLYEKFLKTDISNHNKVKTSPRLFFKRDMTNYMIGLEMKKDILDSSKEYQRVFIYEFNESENNKSLNIGNTTYGTWIRK